LYLGHRIPFSVIQPNIRGKEMDVQLRIPVSWQRGKWQHWFSLAQTSPAALLSHQQLKCRIDFNLLYRTELREAVVTILQSHKVWSVSTQLWPTSALYVDQFQERYIVREVRLFRLVIAHFVIFKLERARLAPPQTSPRCKTKQLKWKSQQLRLELN